MPNDVAFVENLDTNEAPVSYKKLKSPFPWFGGKSKVASLIWERFGKPQNYVEPFFGSGAVLLGCPTPGHTETVNDSDGLLSNFFRSIQLHPDETAQYADYPVSECDLHARHRWLVDRRSMVEDLMSDPEWCDPKIAGWWVWGLCQWIGTGWCPPTPAGVPDVRNLPVQIPHVGDAGRGIHRASDAHALPRQLPSISDGRVGVQSAYAPRLAHKMPFIASPHEDRKQYGLGIHGITYAASGALYAYFQALSARLRRTRVVCGDFERILGPSVTYRHGLSAIFLDPPYADDEHAVTYSGGGKVWERATAYCEENGDNPLLRIALCGYYEEGLLPGWDVVQWRTAGGYGSQGNARGRENADREVVWFSPACLNPADEARAAFDRPITVRDSDYTGTMFEEAL